MKISKAQYKMVFPGEEPEDCRRRNQEAIMLSIREKYPETPEEKAVRPP